MSLITIDGESFDVGIIKITRKARVDKKELGTTLDGKLHYQSLGTYYDYVVTFNTRRYNVSEYDRLYEVLTSPEAEHDVTLPYGQGSISGKYSISTSNDSIVSNFTSFRRWSSLQVTFEALEYNKVAQ